MIFFCSKVEQTFFIRCMLTYKHSEKLVFVLTLELNHMRKSEKKQIATSHRNFKHSVNKDSKTSNIKLGCCCLTSFWDVIVAINEMSTSCSLPNVAISKQSEIKYKFVLRSFSYKPRWKCHSYQTQKTLKFTENLSIGNARNVFTECNVFRLKYGSRAHFG